MLQAILKTLCYADIFDFPLTGGELYTYLISRQKFPQKQLDATLSKLEPKQIQSGDLINRVGESAKIYCLKNREKIFSLRQTRQRYTEDKTKKTRTVGKWLKKIPSIQAVYLTGAVAVGNATKHDDIDLMIITKSGFLWTTRLQTTLLLESLRIRRKPETKHSGREVANKFCLNLYLDESNLALSPEKRNLYTAHEVIQAKLLWQRGNTHSQFLNSNSWATSFLPHSPLPSKPKNGKPPQKKLPNPPNLVSKNLESAAFWLQLRYMQKRQTFEQISSTSAFFHPRDTTSIVLKKYHQRLKRYNLSD